MASWLGLQDELTVGVCEQTCDALKNDVGVCVPGCVEVLVRVSPPETVTEGDELLVSDTEEDTENDGEPVRLPLRGCENVGSPEWVDDTLGDEAWVINCVVLGEQAWLGLCITLEVGDGVPVNEALAAAAWLGVIVDE